MNYGNIINNQILICQKLRPYLYVLLNLCLRGQWESYCDDGSYNIKDFPLGNEDRLIFIGQKREQKGHSVIMDYRSKEDRTMPLLRGYRSHVAIYTHHTTGKKGFRICNIQIDFFLPWKRYTETATGIIQTSHKIWSRRTQPVFHIGCYKKKHSREESFSQKMMKSPWYSKHQLRSELTIREYF